MKKLMFSLLCSAAVFAVTDAHAAAAARANSPAKSPAPVAEAEPPSGGNITLGGEGKVQFVNTCDACDESLATAAKKISNLLMITTETAKGAWSLDSADAAYKATGANIAVFIVKSPSLPLSLIAMESRWGVVNAEGMNAKQLEKAALRVATVLLGGGSYSKYPASSMRPAASLADLDAVGELLTFDSIMSIFPNLEKLGIKQFQIMTYRDACEDGVAPEPANDEQKAIWAEYHK